MGGTAVTVDMQGSAISASCCGGVGVHGDTAADGTGRRSQQGRDGLDGGEQCGFGRGGVGLLSGK